MNRYANNNIVESNGIRTNAGGGINYSSSGFYVDSILTPSVSSTYYYGNGSSLTQTVTSISSSVTTYLSLTSASIFNISLTSDIDFVVTFVFSSLLDNIQYFTFKIFTKGDGNIRNISFPANVRWHNSSGYTTSTASYNRFDAYTFTTFNGGTHWLGIKNGTNFGL